MLAAENSIQLVPDGTLFLHVVIIALMVAVLNRTLFKPLNRVLAERDVMTEGGLSEAKSIVKRAREAVEHYELRLRAARNEGYSLMEAQRLEGLRERQEKIVLLKAEIQSWTIEEKEELGRQSERLRQALERETHVFGREIASQILGRPIGEHLARD